MNVFVFAEYLGLYMFIWMDMFICVRSWVFVCVSDAQPTEGERDVWNQVNLVLQDSESILTGLQAYKGAGQEIRDVRKCTLTRLQLYTQPESQDLTYDTLDSFKDVIQHLALFLLLFVSFQAIQNPNDMMLQERAWNSVCPLVIKLKKFYSFSLRLGLLTLTIKYTLTKD